MSNNTKDDGVLRGFETGATRDTAEGKLDYEGFYSPVVMEQFARFMNMNRLQSDGQLRDSDNWQAGIPMDVYMKSGFRHFMEWWTEHRFPPVSRADQIQIVAAICGLLFNAQGYLHELLKEIPIVEFDDQEPTDEMRERQANVVIDTDSYDRDCGDSNPDPVEGTYPTLEEAVNTIVHFADSINSIKLDVNMPEFEGSHLGKALEAMENNEWHCTDCDSINQLGDPCYCEIQERADNGFDDGEDDDGGTDCDHCGSIIENCMCYFERAELPRGEEPDVCECCPGDCDCSFDRVPKIQTFSPPPSTAAEQYETCEDCRFCEILVYKHPCDCCDLGSNYSPK